MQLVFGQVGGEVVERLKHQHLVHQGDVLRFAPDIALSQFLVNDLEEWAKGFPVDDAVQSEQWITKFLQFHETVFLVEKAGVHRFFPV
jgi:hypothetical protein